MTAHQIANRGESAHQRVWSLVAGNQIGVAEVPESTSEGRPHHIVCQCMSINPGIRVRPPPLIMRVLLVRSTGIGAVEIF